MGDASATGGGELPGFERELRSPSFYLSRLGWLWLAMLALFGAGMVLWFAVGLGRAALLVMFAPMLLLRGRWNRLLGDYTESMLRAGQVPFSVRDWSLITDSLRHVVCPGLPAWSRSHSRDTFSTRNLWLSALPLGLGAWVPIYAGVRAGKRSWCVQGAVWSALVLVGWILSAAAVRGTSSLAGGLVLGGWCGAMVSALLIYRGTRRGASA